MFDSVPRAAVVCCARYPRRAEKRRARHHFICGRTNGFSTIFWILCWWRYRCALPTDKRFCLPYGCCRMCRIFSVTNMPHSGRTLTPPALLATCSGCKRLPLSLLAVSNWTALQQDGLALTTNKFIRMQRTTFRRTFTSIRTGVPRAKVRVSGACHFKRDRAPALSTAHSEKLYRYRCLTRVLSQSVLYHRVYVITSCCGAHRFSHASRCTFCSSTRCHHALRARHVAGRDRLISYHKRGPRNIWFLPTRCPLPRAPWYHTLTAQHLMATVGCITCHHLAYTTMVWQIVAFPRGRFFAAA